MAGGGSLQVSRSKRGKSSKRKAKKRMGFHLDMTPLVDITFLLLTFFMFTTTMAQPQIMEMKVPPESDEKVEVKQSLLFTIIVDKHSRILYYRGMETEPLEEIELSDLKALAIKYNLEEGMKNNLITSLKISPEVNYELVVNILDELNQSEIDISTEIAKDLDGENEPTVRKRKFAILNIEERDIKKINEELPFETESLEEMNEQNNGGK